MPKFKVLAVYEVELEADIEAENIEEANYIADQMDGSDFTVTNEDGWRIYDVVEVQ